MNRALWAAGVLAAVLVCAPAADAGEGLVTKVRGRTLTVDQGADDGLEVGLEVSVVRPPEEAIIHPLTGENLGAPEIEIGSGKIRKVSARAASVQLDGHPILAVRPGDVVRFLTLEEKMVMDQEMSTESAEKAAEDRQQIRSETSRLARNIGSIQGSIRGLEKAIRELRRFDDDVVKPQFRAINHQLNEMREELIQLRETVSLLNAVPVEDIGEGEPGQLTPEELERLRALVQEEIDKLRDQLAAQVPPLPSDSLDLADLEVDTDLAGMGEEAPFFTQLWFWGLLGAVGLGGIAFWLYTHMSAGAEDDEEDDEEDEEEEEEEEDDDLDVDVEEEEDDIVVEETS